MSEKYINEVPMLEQTIVIPEGDDFVFPIHLATEDEDGTITPEDITDRTYLCTLVGRTTGGPTATAVTVEIVNASNGDIKLRLNKEFTRALPNAGLGDLEETNNGIETTLIQFRWIKQPEITV